MKTILVTGGAGYIGSHTVVELQQAGFNAVIVDDLSNSNARVLDRIEAITGMRPEFSQFNLRDKEALRKLFKRHPHIKAVVHFAAAKAVGESVENPLKYYENNVSAAISLLQAMREARIKNFIFSSTAAVYGQPDEVPVSETSLIKKPSSPYGNSKKIIEEIIRDLAKADPAFKSIILRYFNVAGAHYSGKIGELPIGEPQNLIPCITQTAIGVRKELKIYGDDYKTRDGFGIRDYIHVVDLARAHVTAVGRLVKGENRVNCETYNLGTGQGYSVMEVIKTFEEVNKIKINYKIVDRRPGDIDEIYTSAELANKMLGWKATRGLEEMLGSAWTWEKNYREKYS